MTTALSLLHSFRLQNILVEFAALKHVKLHGVYLSLTPRDPALWTGTLFVRKGVYAPAILRFRVSFPSNYPFAPPVITFNSDVFHPLLTPLSTYTYAASGDHETASNDRDERLPPGALSLKHGFPAWFRRGPGSLEASTPNPASAADSDLGSPTESVSYKSADNGETSLVDVLRYMRACFEEESLLDSIPLGSAANPSAWYAWQSQRGRSSTTSATRHQKSNSASPETARSSKASVSSDSGVQATQGRAKQPSEWNWEGVWAERVKKAVQNSLTEQVLYGSANAKDEDIHFLDADEETAESMRAQMRAHVATAQP